MHANFPWPNVVIVDEMYYLYFEQNKVGSTGHHPKKSGMQDKNRVKKTREPVNQVCGTNLDIFRTIFNLRFLICNFVSF